MFFSELAPSLYITNYIKRKNVSKTIENGDISSPKKTKKRHHILRKKSNQIKDKRINFE